MKKKNSRIATESGYKSKNRHSGIAGAFCQGGAAGDQSGDSADKGIHRGQERKSSANEPKISNELPPAGFQLLLEKSRPAAPFKVGPAELRRRTLGLA